MPANDIFDITAGTWASDDECSSSNSKDTLSCCSKVATNCDTLSYSPKSATVRQDLPAQQGLPSYRKAAQQGSESQFPSPYEVEAAVQTLVEQLTVQTSKLPRTALTAVLDQLVTSLQQHIEEPGSVASQVGLRALQVAEQDILETFEKELHQAKNIIPALADESLEAICDEIVGEMVLASGMVEEDPDCIASGMAAGGFHGHECEVSISPRLVATNPADSSSPCKTYATIDDNIRLAQRQLLKRKRNETLQRTADEDASKRSSCWLSDIVTEQESIFKKEGRKCSSVAHKLQEWPVDKATCSSGMWMPKSRLSELDELDKKDMDCLVEALTESTAFLIDFEFDVSELENDCVSPLNFDCLEVAA